MFIVSGIIMHLFMFKIVHDFLLCWLLFVTMTNVSLTNAKEQIKEEECDFSEPDIPEVTPVSTKVVICSISIEYIGKGKLFISNNYFDANLCTHILFSECQLSVFLGADIRETIKFLIEIRYQTSTMASKYPHLKFLLGLTSKGYSINHIVSEARRRYDFINVLKLALMYLGMSGIYWDETVFNYRTKEFMEHQILFFKELGGSLRPHKLLVSVAVDLSDTTERYKFYSEITEICKYVDTVVIQAKDDFVAKYSAFQSDNKTFLVNSFDILKKRLAIAISIFRFDPEKIVLKISFLGQLFNRLEHETIASVKTYVDLLNILRDLENLEFNNYGKICSEACSNTDSKWKFYWDSNAKVPYMVSESQLLIFENPRSIMERAAYAMQLGLQGTMVIHIDADDFSGICTNVTNPLLKTLRLTTLTTPTNESNVCSIHDKVHKPINKPIIFCGFNILLVNLNEKVQISCKIESFSYPTIEWIKITEHGVEQTIASGLSSPELEHNQCTPYLWTVAKIEIEVKSKKDIGMFVIRVSNSQKITNEAFFLDFENRSLAVADDKIWITETDLDFSIHDKPDIKLFKLQEPVVVCALELFHHFDRNMNDNLAQINLENISRKIGEFCTHIAYGKVFVTTELGIMPDDNFENVLRNATKEFQKYTDLKHILEISLESNDAGEKLMFNFKQNASKLVGFLKSNLRRFNMDGIMLSSSFQDWLFCTDLLVFAKEIYKSFREDNLLISVQMEMSETMFLYEHYDFLKEYTGSLDFLFLKGYGFLESQRWRTRHNSPLSSKLTIGNIENNIEHLIKYLGLPSTKLVIEIPLFGFGYQLQDSDCYPFGLDCKSNVMNSDLETNYYIGYKEICSKTLLNNTEWKMYWDNFAKVPFMTNGNNWISFDNSRSIYAKVLLMAKYNMGGVLARSIMDDDLEGHCVKGVSLPLIKTIHLAVQQTLRNHSSWQIIPVMAPSYTWVNVTMFLTAGVVFLLTMFSIWFLWQKKNSKVLTDFEIENFKTGKKSISSNSDAVIDNWNIDSIPYDESYEVSETCFDIDRKEILGTGAYGVVYLGSIKNICDAVAVKTVKPGAGKNYLISLLSELKIMIYLEKHINVVNLLGANTTKLKDGIVYIFFEFSSIGNLGAYLRNSRLHFISVEDNELQRSVESSTENENAITYISLLVWASQIASGLCHLSRKNVVHGDLAARNVLVFENNIIKLTDFGLSCKLYEFNYIKKNQEPLPWRWMAIESLLDFRFSRQSDIWSFGITLWEIFSLGETPYSGLSWSPDFIYRLKENMRLLKPLHANNDVYDFMLDCWKRNPNDRPTAEACLEFFRGNIEKMRSENQYVDICEDFNEENA